MNLQEFFYLSLGIGIWLMVAINLIFAYKVFQAVNSIKDNIKSYSQIRYDTLMIKNSLQAGIFRLISKFLGRVTKGGENYG